MGVLLGSVGVGVETRDPEGAGKSSMVDTVPVKL
jgi:hypothetical protein